MCVLKPLVKDLMLVNMEAMCQSEHVQVLIIVTKTVSPTSIQVPVFRPSRIMKQ